MKEVNIEAVIVEGDSVDTVEVSDGTVVERRQVLRVDCVEERWGRYHLAKQELRPMVERLLDRQWAT